MTPGYLTRSQAVTNYYKSISEEDKELYKNTCYPKVWQDGYINGDAGIGIDAAIDVAFQFQSGATYGEVSINALEKLDKKYADKMASEIMRLYGIEMQISSISKVNFVVKTNFEGANDDSGTITRYVYMSNGKYYFLSDPDIIVLLDLEG